MLGRWVSPEQRRTSGPSAAQPTRVGSPPKELLSDGGINPCMAPVTTPLETPDTCQHLGTCQDIDIGSKTIEPTTATTLFLSVTSSRFQSGPSNALRLRGRETSRSRRSNIDASGGHGKGLFCNIVNTFGMRQGARAFCEPSVRH